MALVLLLFDDFFLIKLALAGLGVENVNIHRLRSELLVNFDLRFGSVDVTLFFVFLKLGVLSLNLIDLFGSIVDLEKTNSQNAAAEAAAHNQDQNNKHSNETVSG